MISLKPVLCSNAPNHPGTVLVEGKTTYLFELPDGRQVKGHDLQQHRDWTCGSKQPKMSGQTWQRLWRLGKP
jgi:hypothetical protein